MQNAVLQMSSFHIPIRKRQGTFHVMLEYPLKELRTLSIYTGKKENGKITGKMNSRFKRDPNEKQNQNQNKHFMI